jgi:hypothetical protein
VEVAGGGDVVATTRGGGVSAIEVPEGVAVEMGLAVGVVLGLPIFAAVADGVFADEPAVGGVAVGVGCASPQRTSASRATSSVETSVACRTSIT